MKKFLLPIIMAFFLAEEAESVTITGVSEAVQDAYIASNVYQVYGEIVYNFTNTGDIYLENTSLNISNFNLPIVRPTPSQTAGFSLTYTAATDILVISYTSPAGATKSTSISTNLTGSPDSKLEVVVVEIDYVSGPVSGAVLLQNVNGSPVSLSSLSDSSVANNPRVAYRITDFAAGNFSLSGIVALPSAFNASSEMRQSFMAEFSPIPEPTSTMSAVLCLLLPAFLRKRKPWPCV